MANQNERIILELLQIDGNSTCVDCGRGKLEKKNILFLIRIAFLRFIFFSSSKLIT